MKISLIVAMGSNRVIGKEGGMPWHLPAELAYFKRVTTGHPIVMGRKTFEAIGKALPGRKNIILTRREDYTAENCDVVHSAEAVFTLLKDYPDEVFVIGGEEVFRQFMDCWDKLYLTVIHHEFEGDRIFPEMNEKNWKKAFEEYDEKDELNSYSFTCYVYEK